MEAFSKVETATSKSITATDQQKGWQSWRQGDGDKASKASGPSGRRATPSFPKLGGAGDDDSNYAVGSNSAVRIPGQAEAAAAKEDDAPVSSSNKRRKVRKDGDDAEDAHKGGDGDDDGDAGQWINLVEPDSGRRYRFNQATGETVFEESARELQELPQAPKKPTAAKLNPYEQVSAAIARKAQAKAQAPAPAASAASGPDAQRQGAATRLAGQWESSVDPNSKRTYYFNRTTGVTSWTMPEEAAGDARPKPGSAFSSSSASPTAASASKAKWHKTKDPVTGKTCWYNRASGETRHTKPT